MAVIKTDLPGVIIIEPKVFCDDRGFFLETFQKNRYNEYGIEADFVQDNHSKSSRGTIRGLHTQLKNPQGKLVRVIEGEIYDVAVDIRRGSPHFGRWTGVWLSSDNFRQLYIPPGFAHGFCVTSDTAQVEYKCTNFYDASSDLSIKWNDPDLDITWPSDIAINPLLSKKDLEAKHISLLMDTLPLFSNTQ